MKGEGSPLGMGGSQSDSSPSELAAVSTIIDVVDHLEPDAGRVGLLHRGRDVLWGGVARALHERGTKVTLVELDQQDRTFALNDAVLRDAVFTDQRLQVLIVHEPFGPGDMTGSHYVPQLAALVGAGTAVVSVAFPHGLSSRASDRIRNVFLSAMQMGVEDVHNASGDLFADLSQGGTLLLRSGSSAGLVIDPPYVIRSDLISSKLDAPIVQLPFGEVWICAAPSQFSGTACVLLGKCDPVLIQVRGGRLTGGPRHLVEASGRHPIVELGIGVNPSALFLPGSALSEKAVGRVHLGFGDSMLLGGQQFDVTHFDIPVAPPSGRGSAIRRLEGDA